MYWFDPTYILIIIGAIICSIASARVNSTYAKYSSYQSSAGMTGAAAAQRLLHYVGINDVRIEHISGNLTDHYDPSSKTLRLSDSVFGATSVAAIGVAAHECGHAIQHNKGYVPLQVRTAIVPVVNFGSTLSWPMILIGVFIGWNQTLIQIGILLFTLVVIFQLITLPVEFNASSRALALLEESGILYHEEMINSRKVLRAAALTYVAGAAASILQLLRLVLLFGRRDD